jgi:hypothetical protein
LSDSVARVRGDATALARYPAVLQV